MFRSSIFSTMFRDTYELTDLFDIQCQQAIPDIFGKFDESSAREQTSESAFLGPILWEDSLTLTDLESINLDDFSGPVLSDAISKMKPVEQDLAVKRDRPARRSSVIVPPSVENTTVKAPATAPRKKTTVPSELKNEVYWDRRRKNNESAKRSRDSRRFLETQVHMKAMELEKENEQLKSEVARLVAENETMRLLLAQRSIPAPTNQVGLLPVSTLVPGKPRHHDINRSGSTLLGL